MKAKKLFLFTTVALTFTATAFAQGGRIPIVDEPCPKGFKKVAPNLCMMRKMIGEKGKQYHKNDCRGQNSKNRTFVGAQSFCRARGAHVCTYAEYAAGWRFVSRDISNKDMLGDYVGDDWHLCVNNTRDSENFEGSCHKHWKYRFRCCVSYSAVPRF